MDAAKAAAVLAANNALGRFSTWAVPVNMSMIYGGFEYAKEYLDGKFTEKTDSAALTAALSTVAGSEATLSTYVDGNGKEVSNYFMLLFDNIDFNDYAK
ncbi:hypothetical protein SDC9_211425 [bioreactor metagenome]|uniref:Uncharacterized protein n=1 Tax=bioreactor metagenome TaxID=1076179 RepID=A0A645JKM8_9ZZZZ